MLTICAYKSCTKCLIESFISPKQDTRGKIIKSRTLLPGRSSLFCFFIFHFFFFFCLKCNFRGHMSQCLRVTICSIVNSSAFLYFSFSHFLHDWRGNRRSVMENHFNLHPLSSFLFFVFCQHSIKVNPVEFFYFFAITQRQ